MRSTLLTLTAVTALTLAGAAKAEVVHFTAKLDGASETPPNTSTGTGTAAAALDTGAKSFSYKLSFSGLSGPATAAHFHMGAPGAAGPPVVPIAPPVTSPVSGSATLTDAQIADLRAGKWYVNVHTAAHPSGEIRGQVLPTR